VSEFLKQFQPPQERQETDKNIVSNLLGLALSAMDESLAQDLIGLIRKHRQEGMDAYVLCMSRLVNHEAAWEILQRVFAKCNKKLPLKYAPLFGKTPEQIRFTRESSLRVG
jgi:hypothetical protein